jgi:hypothetical protein
MTVMHAPGVLRARDAEALEIRPGLRVSRSLMCGEQDERYAAARRSPSLVRMDTRLNRDPGESILFILVKVFGIGAYSSWREGHQERPEISVAKSHTPYAPHSYRGNHHELVHEENPGPPSAGLSGCA